MRTTQAWWKGAWPCLEPVWANVPSNRREGKRREVAFGEKATEFAWIPLKSTIRRIEGNGSDETDAGVVGKGPAPRVTCLGQRPVESELREATIGSSPELMIR